MAKSKFTQREQAKWVQQATESNNVALAAQNAGVSVSTIYRWARELGVSLKRGPALSSASSTATCRDSASQAVLPADAVPGMDDNLGFVTTDPDDYDNRWLQAHAEYAAGFAWEEWGASLKNEEECADYFAAGVDAWNKVVQENPENPQQASTYPAYITVVEALASIIYIESGIEPPDYPPGFNRKDWDEWVRDEAETIITAKLRDINETPVG